MSFGTVINAVNVLNKTLISESKWFRAWHGLMMGYSFNHKAAKHYVAADGF